uniref:hypothetical protein n=1 Tax=Tenacibaculum ovolyticum TaxID=104270 RepID=UPI000B053E4C
ITINNLLIKSISFIEEPEKIKYIKSYNQKKRFSKKEISDIFSIVLITIATPLLRFFFYKNDVYLFSENWFDNFKKTNLLSSNHWFNSDYVETGEFVLIDLFSKISKVSIGMSLQFFGIIQTILLSIIIYWVVKKSSPKKENLISLLFSFVFIGAINFSPLDVNYILKHHNIFSALFLLIPLFIVLIKTQDFHFNKRTKLVYIHAILIASFLISFSGVIILFSLFLLLIFLYDSNKHLKQKALLLFYFIISIILVLSAYMIFYNHGDFNIWFFIKSSFIQISAFSKTANLLFPYINLIKITMLLCFVGIVSTLLIRKNSILLITSLFYLLLAILYQVDHYLIDQSLLFLIFSVFTPMVIGINVVNIINLLSLKLIKTRNIVTASFISLSLFYLIYTQKDLFLSLKISNETNRELLNAYSKITSTHLPYTYAIINHDKAALFSENSHFFTTYTDFNLNYLKRDSVYSSHKKDKKFLKKNPEIILPHSVFLFEILGVDKNVNRIGILTGSPQLKINKTIIDTLKNRKRDIKIYIETNRLRVYEIVNKKSSSNINEILFYDKKS